MKINVPNKKNLFFFRISFAFSVGLFITHTINVIFVIKLYWKIRGYVLKIYLQCNKVNNAYMSSSFAHFRTQILHDFVIKAK